MRSLGEAPTFPADEPGHQLDYILTDDPTLRVDACSAPRLPVSDHRAFVIDISRVCGCG
jgi:endonuclease/exonuclease/phosphatase family metal-dependent hydrolase